MLHDDHLELMGQGALIVGVTDDDQGPFATRAWGLRVAESPEPSDDEIVTVRLLMAADDQRAIAGLGPGRAVAVTAADVVTLRSVQLKGRSRGTTPATVEDVELSARYVREFAAAMEQADGQPPVLFERLAPPELVACTMVVLEAYDQSPGPTAGRELESR